MKTIRKLPWTESQLYPLARLLGLRVRPIEFYASREIPYPEAHRLLESMILSRTSTKHLPTGRIKESRILPVLLKHFPEIVEGLPSGVRALPETVWFSISFGIGTRGDEAQAMLYVASRRFDHLLPFDF